MTTNDSNPSIPDELLSAYLDGELSASEQASVEARLADDPAAREMVEELKAVSQAVRELPRQGADANLQDAILRRIRHQAQVSPRQSSEGKYTVGRSKRGWIWAAAAIAAALLVMAYQGQFGPAGRIQEVAQQADKSLSSPPVPKSGSTPGFVNAPAPASQGGGGGGMGGAADFDFSEPMAESSAVASRSETKVETPALVPSSGLAVDESMNLRRGRASASNRSMSAKPIVVQLTMPMESRRNRVLETVLAQQEIVADEEEIQLGQEYPQEYPDVEIVSVEAPQRDIVSCLAAIEKDTRNFLNVDVQELLQGSLEIDSLEGAGLADRAKAAHKSANQWEQYNRGGPIPQQHESQQQISQQWALLNNVQKNVQAPANEFRQLQKRKSRLTGRSSSSADETRADENWQQVFFVIGSEQSTAVPTSKKASAN